MLYVVLILIVTLGAVMLLRLRVRLEISDGDRRMFVGLGRTGTEFDFTRKTGLIKLCNRQIGSFRLDRDKKKEPIAKAEKKTAKKARPKKQRSWADILSVLIGSVEPLWSFSLGILRNIAIEEAHGEIQAGFDSPDLTGIAFGYYSAAAAAVPAMAGRVRFTPDWQGPSFSGKARLTVALPLYRLVARLIVLLFRLPLRELFKVAIGKKKGGRDGQ